MKLRRISTWAVVSFHPRQGRAAHMRERAPSVRKNRGRVMSARRGTKKDATSDSGTHSICGDAESLWGVASKHPGGHLIFP